MDRDPARGRAANGEQGFTLVELLVATAIGLVVMLAIAGFATFAQRSQSDTGARADRLGAQRQALEQMTRELRQATTINTTTPGLVDFQVYGSAPGSVRQIRYDCRTSQRCRRYEGPVPGSLTLTNDALVENVNTATFTTQTVAASQDYVGIELRVALPNRPLPIPLTDGVHLRNKAAM